MRTKLIASVLALVILALVTISIASVYVLRSYLTTERDSDLANAFAIAANRSATPGYFSQFPNSSAVYGIQENGQQLGWQSNNTFGNAQVQSLPQLPANTSWATRNTSVTWTVPAQSGGDTWRIMAQKISTVTFPSGQQGTGILVVGIDLGNIGHTIRKIEAFDVAVSAGIVLILTIAGIAIVRANLRPLEEIEETAQEIAAGHLNRRVPERDPRTEVGSLGQSLNIMLSQIESAFRAQQQSEEAAHQSEERMRQFVADASHELRTPLTAIRGFAEYYRQRGGLQTPDAEQLATTEHLTPDDLDRMMHRVESEASRMGLLVEDLLLLARLDQQRPLEIKPVDLLTLAADAVQDARIIAPDRELELEVAPGAAFIVNGDEARLRQVIGNLMNNALTHTPAGTPVTVRIGSGKLPNSDPAAVLSVADSGPGLPPEQARRVFERFYRADASRTRMAGGSGLGLAIVASLVAAHDGTVSVQTAPGKGATFRVMLPLAPEARE